MFKIGEFSKITQVSVRMLRYYDEQKLLEPCCVDKMTGYRMYAASQIEELNRIIFLRDMGFHIQEMKAMLPSWNTDNIKQNLLNQVKRTEESIKAEEMRLTQLQGFLYDLEHQEEKGKTDITLKQLPMQYVISMRKIVPDYYQEGKMWQEFMGKFKHVKEVKNFPSFSIYHDLDYREENVDIEICVATERRDLCEDSSDIIYRQISQVDVAACFMVYGPYSNISKAYKEFAYWLEQHREYEMQGENRQICHVSMCHTENPNEYITELQIPLVQK